jgi:predicted nucleotidyltransferase component of viral defense system
MSKNIAASVKQKLLSKAKEDGRPFNEVLQYYVMERFLYRLSQSSHKERFILKGALMLRAWQSSALRPTMDIDMLGITSNEIDNIVSQIKHVASVDIDPDGLLFDTKTITAEEITEEADYRGVRVSMYAFLEKAKTKFHVDIGFGDVVHPGYREFEFPTLLSMPAPVLLGYSKESAIAEKFQAMVKLGIINSRMKDFYDIWLLSRQYEFDNETLAEAIRLTFENRETEIPDEIVAFSDEFIEEKQIQWAAFRKRMGQEHIPEDFREVVYAVRDFLTPVVQIISS